MGKKYSINFLSKDFYSAYNSSSYPEIERKDNRPYVVFLVQIKNNKFALPFRTTMNHKNGYLFSKTGRATGSKSGIDFSKAVIVNDCAYIGQKALVDSYEYAELTNKYMFIIRKFEKYLDNYIDVVEGRIKNKYVIDRYKFCTLKYFHKELGICQPVIV